MIKSNAWFRAGLAAAIFLLTTAPASPQALQFSQEENGLQVSGNEVLLDLVVHDKRNRPVLDLQPQNISVTDNGTPVQLTGLRLVNSKQQNEPLITLLFDRPGIDSNMRNAEEADFGRAGTSPHEMSERMRDAAERLLKVFPASGFQFAVMDVWGRLQLQQDFSGDRKVVSQAISMAVEPGQYGIPVTSSPVEERLARLAQTGQDAAGVAVSARERTLARSMFGALQSSGRITGDQHISSSLACLLALVQAQQSLPGRKAIVYFISGSDGSSTSNGTTRNDSQSKTAIHSIIGAANRAGVNIYVVRVRGLDASKAMAAMLQVYSTMSINSADLKITPATATSSGISGYQVAQAGQFSDKSAFRSISSMESAAISARDGLDLLAKGTGGDSMNASENFSGPAKELVRDLTSYYEATYVPPTGEEDGSFHATAVTALRAGLKVRTRTGYLALPPSVGISTPPQPFELPLMALLKRVDFPAEVNYRAAILHMGHQGQNNMSLVAVEAPVDGLEVREDTSTHLASAHLSILATIKDGTGAAIERFSEDVARRWSVNNGAGGRPEVISFERPFTAPPGEYVLETAVMDNNSGKGAGRRQSFNIAAASMLPEMSQLVLVRDMETAGQDSQGFDPLVYGDFRLRPNLYGELPAGVPQMSVYFLAHTDPKSQEPATVKLEVLRDGVALGGAPLAATLQTGGDLHPVMNTFSIGSAASGQYQVKAILTQGGKTTETTGDFVLTGEKESGTDANISEAALMSDPFGLDISGRQADRAGSEELDVVLADARKNALDYGDSLPNLICQQTTERAEDSKGDGNWKHKDTLVELLTYVGRSEERTPVVQEEHNKQKTGSDVREIGMLSAGEFGEALNGIFRPSSKADFKWSQSATLRGEAVEVFEYRIERANSTFSLQAGSGFASVGYHGRIYVDRATHGVRSVSLITDEAPKNFPIRRAAVRVDYDYVAINDHDYLLPVDAQVVVGQGKRTLERNDLEFTNFRRFGSSLRIVDSTSEEKSN